MLSYKGQAISSTERDGFLLGIQSRKTTTTVEDLESGEFVLRADLDLDNTEEVHVTLLDGSTLVGQVQYRDAGCVTLTGKLHSRNRIRSA